MYVMNQCEVTTNEKGRAFCCQVQEASNKSHPPQSAPQLADAKDIAPHIPNFRVTVNR